MPGNVHPLSQSANETPHNEESDWISDDDYRDDSLPVHNGSTIPRTNAIHWIVNLYLTATSDKQKVNSYVRPIKSTDGIVEKHGESGSMSAHTFDLLSML